MAVAVESFRETAARETLRSSVRAYINAAQQLGHDGKEGRAHFLVDIIAMCADELYSSFMFEEQLAWTPDSCPACAQVRRIYRQDGGDNVIHLTGRKQ